MELLPTSPTVRTPAENFTGAVYLDQFFAGDDPANVSVALVRFTPGAHTNWHSHAQGQLLVCTDGIGLVATRDGGAVPITPGRAVWTAPGEEHWHGGTARTMMCHFAIVSAPPTGEATTWLEPVADDDYTRAHAAAGIADPVS